jgi:hypothetical protein
MYALLWPSGILRVLEFYGVYIRIPVTDPVSYQETHSNFGTSRIMQKSGHSPADSLSYAHPARFAARTLYSVIAHLVLSGEKGLTIELYCTVAEVNQHLQQQVLV